MKHQAYNSLRIEKDDVVDTEGNTGKVLKSTSVRDHDTDLVGPMGRSELCCINLFRKSLQASPHNSMTQQASEDKIAGTLRIITCLLIVVPISDRRDSYMPDFGEKSMKSVISD